jgi:hypothetical protein
VEELATFPRDVIKNVPVGVGKPMRYVQDHH